MLRNLHVESLEPRCLLAGMDLNFGANGHVLLESPPSLFQTVDILGLFQHDDESTTMVATSESLDNYQSDQFEDGWIRRFDSNGTAISDLANQDLRQSVRRSGNETYDGAKIDSQNRLIISSIPNQRSPISMLTRYDDHGQFESEFFAVGFKQNLLVHEDDSIDLLVSGELYRFESVNGVVDLNPDRQFQLPRNTHFEDNVINTEHQMVALSATRQRQLESYDLTSAVSNLEPTAAYAFPDEVLQLGIQLVAIDDERFVAIGTAKQDGSANGLYLAMFDYQLNPVPLNGQPAMIIRLSDVDRILLESIEPVVVDGTMIFSARVTTAEGFRSRLFQLNRNGNVVQLPWEPQFFETVEALAAGPDGRATVVTRRGAGGPTRLVRIAPDGGHDPSYGINGTAWFDSRFDPNRWGARRVLPLSGRKSLVLYREEGREMAIRLHKDGTIDSSFGSDGRIDLTKMLTSEPTESVYRMELVPSERGFFLYVDVVRNSSLQARTLVIVLDENGHKVESFGDSGQVSFEADEAFNRRTPQIVAGKLSYIQRRLIDNGVQFVLVQIDSAGVVEDHVLPVPENAFAAGVDVPRLSVCGKRYMITVGIRGVHHGEHSDSFAVLQYDENWQLDSEFGDAGVVRVPTPSPLTDGWPIVACSRFASYVVISSQVEEGVGVYRIDTAGSVGFERVLSDELSRGPQSELDGTYHTFWGLVADDRERLTMGVTRRNLTDAESTIYRISRRGELDLTFNGNGQLSLPASGYGDHYNDLRRSPSGSDVIYAGQLHQPFGSSAIIGRTAPDRIWTNFARPADVDQDGRVFPLDALLVINMLNSRGTVALADEAPIDNVPLVDVNDDGWLSPLDALLIINELNRPETTASVRAFRVNLADAALATLAVDTAADQSDSRRTVFRCDSPLAAAQHRDSK